MEDFRSNGRAGKAGPPLRFEALARIARDFGREPATTDEAKEIFGIRS